MPRSLCSLAMISNVFDKLNCAYQEHLEAEANSAQVGSSEDCVFSSFFTINTTLGTKSFLIFRKMNLRLNLCNIHIISVPEKLSL